MTRIEILIISVINNVKAGFSMTKKMIIVKIVEFLMIVIITVIKLT